MSRLCGAIEERVHLILYTREAEPAQPMLVRDEPIPGGITKTLDCEIVIPEGEHVTYPTTGKWGKWGK
jgi:hypothetical protein